MTMLLDLPSTSSKMLSRLRGEGVAAVLARGSSSAFVVRLAGTAVAFGIQILLARLLGAKQYGTYMLALTWINLLALLATLGLDVASLRYIPTYEVNEEWSSLRGLLLKSRSIVLRASLCIAGLGILVMWFSPFHFEMTLKKTFTIAFCILPIVVLVRLRLAVLRALKMVIQALLPQDVLRPFFLGLLVILVSQVLPSRLQAPVAMLCNLFAMLGVLILSGFWMHRRLPVPVHAVEPRFTTRDWLAVAVPLLLISGMQMVLKRTDIIMLGGITGTEAAGIYAVAAQISSLLGFGLNSMNFIAAPMIAQLHASHRKAKLQNLLSFSAKGIFIFTAPTAILMIILGEWLLGLFGPKFPAGYHALIILLVAQIINAFCGFVGLMMSMTGHQNQSALILGISTIVNILLNVLLIPRWGVMGAAVATGITTVLWNISMLIYVRTRLRIDPSILSMISARMKKPRDAFDDDVNWGT
jgi:O-antigen/teichoic acid export membrane protein